MKKIGIYKITNPVGAIYIGESKDIEERWNREYKKLRCKNQTRLYNSFMYYGVENHTFEIVKECTVEEIPYYERHYQEYYNVLDKDYGLNLKYTSVGEKKLVFSNETKLKMSSSQKKLYENGYKNPMQGKKRSEEQVKKHTEFLKNLYKNGKEPWNKGKTGIYNDETLKKMKKEKSDEHKRKLSEAKKGKKRSENNNGNSKKVINTETLEIYNSAAECERKTGYKKLQSKLSGSRKNNTPFKYL